MNAGFKVVKVFVGGLIAAILTGCINYSTWSCSKKTDESTGRTISVCNYVFQKRGNQQPGYVKIYLEDKYEPNLKQEYTSERFDCAYIGAVPNIVFMGSNAFSIVFGANSYLAKLNSDRMETLSLLFESDGRRIIPVETRRNWLRYDGVTPSYVEKEKEGPLIKRLHEVNPEATK